MSVHLKIQWGYTSFLTWHCKTNYFKYKLCLVYTYMRAIFLCLYWSMRSSSECHVFFFLRVAQPKAASSDLWRSSKPNSFLSLHGLLPLLFLHLAKRRGGAPFGVLSDTPETLLLGKLKATEHTGFGLFNHRKPKYFFVSFFFLQASCWS